MDTNEIDIKKLEHCHMLIDADNRALRQIIDNLRSENEHLRELIHILITNLKSV